MNSFRFLRPEKDRNQQYCEQSESPLLRSVRPLQYLWFPYRLLYFFAVCFFFLSNVDVLYHLVESVTPEEYNFAAIARFVAVTVLVTLLVLTLAALPFSIWYAYRELWAPAKGWPGPLQVYFTDYLSNWRKCWDAEVVVPNQRLAAAAKTILERTANSSTGFANVGTGPQSVPRQHYIDLSAHIPQTNVPYAMAGALDVGYLPEYTTSEPEEDVRALFGAIAFNILLRFARSLVFYDLSGDCLVLLIDKEGTGPCVEHKIMIRLWPEGSGDKRRMMYRTRYLAMFFEGRYGQSKNFGDGSYHYEGDWKHLLRLDAFRRYTTSGRIRGILAYPLHLLIFGLRLLNPLNFFSFTEVQPIRWPYLVYREWMYGDSTEAICSNAHYHHGDFFGFWLLRSGLQSVDAYFTSVARPERDTYLEGFVAEEVQALHKHMKLVLSELVSVNPQTYGQKPGGSDLNRI